MKIQYCSDLHLEFPENKKWLKEHPLLPVGEVLVLAGDIVPFCKLDEHQDFFNWASDNFRKTYWLPGNHEYYYSDINNRSGQLNETIRANVHLVNNHWVEEEGVRLLFSTLWSKIRPEHAWPIQQSVADFQVVKDGEGVFSPDRFNELHHLALQFLADELAESYEGETLVATHHVPTFYHYPEEYRRDIISEAFAAELYDLIAESNVNYWFYGHHHRNIQPFSIGRTQMLTNQLGYIRQVEHYSFEYDKVIDVGGVSKLY